MTSSADRPDSPLHDASRTRALWATGLLDTLPEPVFDRVTRIAASSTGAPASLMTLIAPDRAFVKSVYGAELVRSPGTQPLAESICRHVVQSGASLVVADARRDAIVGNEPGVRAGVIGAYLGTPLRVVGGHTLGALCVLSDEPREWSPDDVRIVAQLADIVDEEITRRYYDAERATAALAERARKGRQSPSAGAPHPEVAGATVLVVDDDPQVLRLTARMLRDLGHHVIEAEDGPQAMLKGAAYSGTLHLVVTDIGLPGVHGLTVASHIVAARPETQVLYISGKPQNAQELGAPFLPKPFSARELGEQVSQLLRKGAQAAG